MENERDIEKSIRKLAGTYLKDIVSIVICTVDTVDKGGRSCDCTPISGDAATAIPSVQLMAENNNGLVVFPKVGSTVIVALSSQGTAFVVMFSDLDSVLFFDGSFGGLVKVESLVSQLNTQLSNLMIAITAAYTAQTGFDGSAGLNAWNTAKEAVPALEREPLENNLILHGE